MTTAQTEIQSFSFGVPSPEIVINKTEFFPGEKVDITVQKIPPFLPNTDPRLELYIYLPFLQKIGTNVPLNCLGESCIVVYSFDEIRKGDTNQKTISFVLFSEKNSKPIVESGWMNSVCDLKFNGKIVERYGNTCNSLDLPPGIYEIKFGWGIEISDKFEIFKTIPITVKSSSDNIEPKNQTSEKPIVSMFDKETETKEAIDKGTEIETITIEKELESTQKTDEITPDGGGCLIATATFGSELAPQVQQLRELRDNTILTTTLGTAFMTGFNQLYYSFSPTIADLERENLVFKEMIKITLIPLLTSLSILNYVDIDSEADLLGYGISLILLNVGMYFMMPAIMIIGIKKRF